MIVHRSKKRTRPSAKALRTNVAKKVGESDSKYFLKLVLYIILGTLWLKFSSPVHLFGIPFMGLPLGMVCGLLLVHRIEPIQDDRKIWYAILVLVTITSYFLPAGILL